VGSYGLARLFFPTIAGHAAKCETPFGCVAVGIVGLSFLIGLRRAPAALPVRPPQTYPSHDQ
jgi:hypothetical protein